MLSDEDAEKIKQQIIQQIESTFPEEKKSSAINQIKAMNSEQLENFLKRNNLIRTKSSEKGNPNCVFCAIVSDIIKSCKIDENSKAIAILEINPISKGHSIIIPKEHTDELQKDVLELAEKVSKNIKKKLKPKKVEIAKSELFGHKIINVVPIYKDENINSERKKATLEELEIIKGELEKETPKIKKPAIEELNSKKIWLPKRIP